MLLKRVAAMNLTLLGGGVTVGVAVPIRYSQHGFAVQGIQVIGGVLAFHDLWLQWRVDKLENVTPESLALVQLLKPLPELVVFGVGPELRRLPETLVDWLRQQELQIEVLATVSCVSRPLL